MRKTSPSFKFYIVLIPLFALVLLSACGKGETNPPSRQNPSPSSRASMDFDFDGTLLTGTYEVIFHTSLGDMTLELDADAAPKTVTNFIVLSRAGYYDGLTFHRVIPDFMIQGGDPMGTGQGGESVFGPSFEDEPNGVVLEKGVIAMANRGPNTNGSQFFIIQRTDGTPWLQGKHTGFGRITRGMDVLDKIALAPRDNTDNPVTPVTFTVEVVE